MKKQFLHFHFEIYYCGRSVCRLLTRNKHRNQTSGTARLGLDRIATVNDSRYWIASLSVDNSNNCERDDEKKVVDANKAQN